MRDATAAEVWQQTRELAKEPVPVEMWSMDAPGGPRREEERPLAAVFDEHPQLYDVCGVGEMLAGWVQDPARARAYAEAAARAGWPGLAPKGSRKRSVDSVGETEIGLALRRGSASSSQAGPSAGASVGRSAAEEAVRERRSLHACAAEGRAEAARRRGLGSLRGRRSTKAGRRGARRWLS